MSYERGWGAINLEMPDRIPHTEYLDHDEFIEKVINYNTADKNQNQYLKYSLAKALDYDFLFSICEMPLEKGRVTKMGYANWNKMCTQDNEVYCPFETEEDVLNFDAVEEYGLPEINETSAYFQKHLDQANRLCPDTVHPGGRYDSLFTACIDTFGWEMFLASAPQDPGRFDKVLESFYRRTKAEIEAWINCGIKVFLMHDDICWTAGAVFHPEWYRKYIFPRYKKLWEPLREAGIKVIYCSDGTFTQFIDDIAAAGADGFILEPTTSLEYIVEKYGKTKVIIGNMDCRILQYGTKEDIYNEVKRCADLGKDCPGYFFAVGNHIPNGIPLEHVEYYFELKDRLGRR